MNKKTSVFIMSLSLIVLTIFSPLICLKANEEKVIKVGYPMLQNLSMKDDDGNYYGYDFEFLEQIAQHTGWKYEFVEVEGDINTRLTKLLEMLKNGEIDLLASLTYSDKLAEVYDYASEPYGYSYDALLARNDSEIYDQNSLLAKKNLRIAVSEKATVKADKLAQFARMNGLTYEVVLSKGSVLKTLNEGLADVALSTDSGLSEGYHSVARFFPTPFYFVTTKGNSEVLQELNQALINIDQSNPSFSATLYDRYFTGGSNEFMFNAAEREYLKNHKEINVLARNNHAPLQYLTNGEVKGVAKDILDVLSKNTGVTFNYTVADNYEHYLELNNSGEFDILLSVPYEIKASENYNISLSNPYFSGNLSLITKYAVNPNDLSGLTEGKTNYTFKEYNGKQRGSSVNYDTAEEVLNAIDKGQIDYTYLNNYIATYYVKKDNLEDLILFNVPEHIKSQYSFGVNKSADLTLLRILNKTIDVLDEEIDSMIYKNASVEKNYSLSQYIQENILTFISVILLASILIIYIIRRYYLGQIKMKKAVEVEYKRYQLLYDITGEMTFVYDYLNDELKISNSGLNKLANENIIHEFVATQVNKPATNNVEYVIFQNLMKKKDVNIECELTLVNQEVNWYQLTMKLVTDDEKDYQQAIYGIGKILDIQKSVNEKEILKQNSMTDPLTGIWNRSGAYSLISDKLTDNKHNGALIMLDLDNFKDVNDNFGHLDGDIVLQQTAQVLMRVFKDSIVARLGGDEFIIYIEDATLEVIENSCKEAIESVKHIEYTLNKGINMSMSMGVCMSGYSHNFETLLKCADEKLYEVKRSGKNGYGIYQHK